MPFVVNAEAVIRVLWVEDGAIVTRGWSSGALWFASIQWCRAGLSVVVSTVRLPMNPLCVRQARGRRLQRIMSWTASSQAA